MNMVVLDGYTLSSGDISWEPLKALADYSVIYDRTPPDMVYERAKDAEIVLTNKTVLNRTLLLSLKKLKYIGVLATGYNVVDIACASELGITVTNIPSYGTESVAQTVFALLLEVVVGAGRQSRLVKNERWTDAADFCFYENGLFELCGKTLGIIGMGNIGRRVHKIGSAFGMKTICYDPFVSEASREDGVEYVEKEMLLSKSDVVSLHCPLTEENKGIICKETIALMKDTAILINTARGPLVNEKDLADALNNGELAGAGVDVLCIEPPQKDNPLFFAKNIVITPHQAWAAKEARERLMNIAVGNIKQFIIGNPVNVVNKK